ncbi:flagellar basal-body MS-ring/collar protein FliF [Pandoraea pulmonicola]|nr:flagellar basal-body MS-ring/collar protein FliF [Pandoraea pulmonicola]AJC23318.1 flagellar M-ring protein FliF [Pandoraea pulmonicola]
MPSPATLSKVVPLVLLAVALTAFATLYMRYDQSSYKPLFGAREQVPLDSMVSVLDADGIKYRIHPDTGQVLVPSSELGRARLLLAAKGVTAKLPEGLEQVGSNDPLGTSQFVQDVRFRRGLEAELVKSIVSMDPIESARVHLSIAKSSSFVMMDGEKSSASVVLTLKPGQRLSREQIAAVINLVAGSVPNLAPERVSVVDQSGAFLSARVDLTDDPIGSGDAVARYRETTMRSVQDLLAPTLGMDNFRVSVTPVVNNDRVEETREQFGEAPKVVNEAIRDEKNRDRTALGVPGSLSNRPVEATTATQNADGGTMRNAATRQFAYDRNVMQIKHSRGRLERLSVAVVLNNAVSPTKGQPWSDEQLKHIDTLLRNGLGMDASRGDQLVVSAMNFPSAPQPQPWWEERTTLEQGAWYAAYAVMALLGFLLVVRPLLRITQQWVEYRYAPRTLKEIEPDVSDATDALVVGQQVPLLANDEQAPDKKIRGSSMLPLMDDIELPPADSGVEILISHLQTLCEKEPERVAEVVKQWIQNDGNLNR